ncbi:hypothetical protein RI054_07g38710 [Pseudoscourfieldia marina]
MYEAEVRRHMVSRDDVVSKDDKAVEMTRTRSGKVAHVAAVAAWQARNGLANANTAIALTNQKVLEQLMQELQPDCSTRAMTNIMKAMVAARNPRALPCVATVPGALEQLWRYIALDQFDWVLDAFAGTQAVRTFLMQRGVAVVSNDVNPAHAADLASDACQPDFWRSMQNKGLKAVVCSPWYDCLDLVLPLAVRYTPKLVCVHVSYSYYANMTAARAAMFRRWLDQERVAIISNLPRVGRQRQCAWICVFGSARDKEQLVRQPRDAGWLFVADPEAPLGLV